MGPYDILAPIGAGGMGEVYRARDTRLGREVAIKLLGERFTSTNDGHDRLVQEARAVSALNHPNIVALYDICSENGNEFLVIELVRGKTLDQLIGNRGVGVNEALKYAIPMADAIARAHAAGILHLDLKPSNIMITENGVPKILDFGLAQAAESEDRRDLDQTRSLTDVSPQPIAGTAAYMSPEQAEGKKLDARSDIFSFGAVLYEMVTGRQAFHGDSTASTLAAVLRHEPEAPSRITPRIPKELERVIQRCLRKDPNRRFHSMNDVKVELEEVGEESESGMQAAVEGPAKKRRVWMYIAGGFALLGIAAAIWWLRQTAPHPAPSEPVPLTSERGFQAYPDFSPDGNQLVFAWNGDNQGKYHIYVKPVASPNYLQLTKGDAIEFNPVWSPDGQWIAFQRQDNAGEHTFVMSPIGGNERRLHDGACTGLSWSNDGRALGCGSPSGIILIFLETGEARQLTFVPNGQIDVYPAFSPDGHKLLFMRGEERGSADLYLLELSNELVPRGASRRMTAENPVNWRGLAWMSDGRQAIWSMSKTTPQALTLYRVPIAEKGSIQPLPFVGRATYPAVARRQNRLAYMRWLRDIDIWRADGHTGERDPVSSTQLEWNPQFSPDGKRIAFESDRSGPQEIWVANSDGTEPVRLTNFGRHCGSPRWSSDGHWIIFDAEMGSGQKDIWVIESSSGKPRRLTTGPGNSAIPSFSQGGNWIYFSNDRTGRREVFRMPFGGGAATQITRSSGEAPQQSVDGKSVYYVKPSLPEAALCEARVEGGQEHPLGITVLARAFQVMSNGIYFITRGGKDGHDREIRFYDFATLRSSLIQPLGEVDTYLGFAVSPDRKAFLYPVQKENGGNLMLIENFR